MTTKSHAFDLADRVFIITGGAGFLGKKHAIALADAGASVALYDIHPDIVAIAEELSADGSRTIVGYRVDITDENAIRSVFSDTVKDLGVVCGLINNAANNPKLGGEGVVSHIGTLEDFPREIWEADLNVGITAAFLMSKVVGSYLAEQGKGVIVNIASDLSIIAPDHRIYITPGMTPENAQKKQVSYSVVKHALIGLTKYLATYWADKGVRSNAISPCGIWQEKVNQDFVKRYSNLIPMGRMALPEDVTSVLLFLCSDASSFITGQNIAVDGGRTIW